MLADISIEHILDRTSRFSFSLRLSFSAESARMAASNLESVESSKAVIFAEASSSTTTLSIFVAPFLMELLRLFIKSCPSLRSSAFSSSLLSLFSSSSPSSDNPSLNTKPSSSTDPSSVSDFLPKSNGISSRDSSSYS